MKKLITLLFLLVFVFFIANIESANAAKKTVKKAAPSIPIEELTAINTDIEKLTSKVFQNSLFSPEENAQIIQTKMKLDTHLLASPMTEFAPMYYKLGKLLKIRGYKTESIDCFQTILENFADTALAPKAKTELETLGVIIKEPEQTDEGTTEQISEEEQEEI